MPRRVQRRDVVARPLQRVAFAESARGLTILELDPESTASKEIDTLAKEVLKLVL